MKRICLLFLLTVAITSAFAQSEEARQRQWDSYGYGQFYVVSYLYSGPSILDYDEYEDNTWKVAYDAETNVLSLYLNGELKQTASWEVDLVINSILGRADDELHMIGSVDWMKITIEK